MFSLFPELPYSGDREFSFKKELNRIILGDCKGFVTPVIQQNIHKITNINS